MREKCWPRNVTGQRPDTQQHTTPSHTDKHTHKQVRVKHNIQEAGVKSGYSGLNSKWPVLWIRDILERILIRGSAPMTFGSGSCSSSSRCQKIVFWSVHLHQSSKIKSKKVKPQNSRNNFLLDNGRIRIGGSGKPKNLRTLRIRIHNTWWGQ
jgi:hypothetical protein